MADICQILESPLKVRTNADTDADAGVAYTNTRTRLRTHSNTLRFLQTHFLHSHYRIHPHTSRPLDPFSYTSLILRRRTKLRLYAEKH